jgi:hypothetical protein
VCEPTVGDKGGREVCHTLLHCGVPPFLGTHVIQYVSHIVVAEIVIRLLLTNHFLLVFFGVGWHDRYVSLNFKLFGTRMYIRIAVLANDGVANYGLPRYVVYPRILFSMHFSVCFRYVNNRNKFATAMVIIAYPHSLCLYTCKKRRGDTRTVKFI